MKYVVWWQFFCTTLLIIISEIFAPIITEIGKRNFTITYELLFIIVIYALGGIIISLSKLKENINIKLNYVNLVIFLILLGTIAMMLYFKVTFFNSFILLKSLAFFLGFFFLGCFIQNVSDKDCLK